MNYIRDNKTRAVLNADAEALNKYKVERTYYRKVEKIQLDLLEIKRSIISICERIEELENR